MASGITKSPSVRQSNNNHESKKLTKKQNDSSAALGDDVSSSSRYHMIKTIGKGNFAKVKLAKHIPTGQEVAIKIIDKTQLNPTSLQKLRREVKIMKVLDHPNIVKLYEVIETERTLYLVIEFASRGELFDYLVAHGRMKEKDARSTFRQIISAVQYCHRKQILHRDLKAENLLLDEDLNIKIADFGFSNEFVIGTKLDTFCGSPPYAAPELFQGKKYDGPEVDVWSLGVILYTLVSGSLPFDGQNLKELRERVLRGKYRIPFYMSTDCENLLKKFLVLNPLKRATLDTALRDQWLNTGFEDDRLRPYQEPPTMIDDQRIDLMVNMGYNRRDIEQSLVKNAYDHLMATYLLLGKQQKQKGKMELTRAISCTTPRSSSHATRGQSALPGVGNAVKVIRSSSSAAAQPNDVNKNALRREVDLSPKKLESLKICNGETITIDQPASIDRSKSSVSSQPKPIVVRRTETSSRSSTPAPPLPLISTPTTTTSKFGRGSLVRTTLSNPASKVERAAADEGSIAMMNSSVIEEAEDAGGTLMPPISRTNRKSFLNKLSDKFHRSKSTRRSETMTQQHTALKVTSKSSTYNASEKVSSASNLQSKFKNSNNGGDSNNKTNDNNSTSQQQQQQAKPRTLHFTWHLKNTSPMEPHKMIAEVRQVLDSNQCDFYQTQPFVVHCSHGGGSADGGGSHVGWTMEVCRLPRLSLNGIKFKKVTGPTLIYKNIVAKIANELKF